MRGCDRAVLRLFLSTAFVHTEAVLTLPAYVLITPARNEAQFIGLTIRSVVMQTVRPIKWIIVSDGSTDATDEIVSKYARDHPWIELIRMPERRERHFAGKVHAFNAGYARVKDLDYDAIGSLDADISFDENYFPFLLGKLAKDPTLGLVGTPFKEIGGYVSVRGGCIDYIAVITARMKGWKTRTFTDKVCLHQRGMGTAQQGMWMARFKLGQKDHSIGNHPSWELFRAAYQMTKRPFVIGGLLVLSGYIWALVQHKERPVPRELVAFVRREQIRRLRRFLTGKGAAYNESCCTLPSIRKQDQLVVRERRPLLMIDRNSVE